MTIVMTLLIVSSLSSLPILVSLYYSEGGPENIFDCYLTPDLD